MLSQRDGECLELSGIRCEHDQCVLALGITALLTCVILPHIGLRNYP